MTLLTLLGFQAGEPEPGPEAFTTGGFLPDNRDEQDRRRKRLRATLEGVVRPKPKAIAREIREAVAPAPEPAPVTIRDAVKPEVLTALRRLAEGAAAEQARRAALDDDDEDVLLLLGV